jgi:hypothetical protein
LYYFFPYFLFQILSRCQGLSHKGYVLKPPLPEAREANRLNAEAVKKRKDVAKAKAARKREREEEHKKAGARARSEALPPPPTLESTEEEDSSIGGVDF